ncbi:MAG: class I SAM-dependent methyltransferase [Anaerolineales bacterium]|nr:class I SAM-dependent methyltransferase [Anaerolineales bacterium]
MHHFLELGPMPLANSFLQTPEEFADEPFFPMGVYFCADCTLVQLLDVIDPEVLFRHYLYVTGTSDTIARHNVKYAQTVVELLGMGPDDLVVEVASNDGSLLSCFQTHNVRTLGVDPARNVAEIARARGVETVAEFFSLETAVHIREKYGPAKAVIGNNVLAHVDDTPNFLAGFKHLIDTDGLVIIEMPYLRNLLEGLEYDTIYHEHLCYFSVNALLQLCDRVGLSLVRIDYVPVHGGSLRMYAGRPEHYGGHGEAVLAWAEEERQQGMTGLARYEQFAQEVADSRTELLALLNGLLAEGKTIAGYGASAKGTTLINYCGIDTRILPYTVDKSPLKVNLYTPGTHIPVLPVDTLLEKQPDYVLILAWNFAEEIMRQQQTYHDRGGQFIVPIPKLRVV